MAEVNLELARKVIAAAEKKAGDIGQPMNIAVVDAGGKSSGSHPNGRRLDGQHRYFDE